MNGELNFEALPFEVFDGFRTLASEEGSFEVDTEFGGRGHSRGFPARTPRSTASRSQRRLKSPVGGPKKLPGRPHVRLPRWPWVVGFEPYRAVAEPYPVESPPAGSEYTRWVQSALNNVLGIGLPLHGIADSATRSAIRSFQQREGLPVDGVVGPDTERALLAARGGRSPPGGSASPVAPDMAQPSEPTPTSPAQELSFEWENFPEFESEHREYESALDVLSSSELKAVRITSTFETGRPGGFGGLTGNIDGQGLSFGLLNFTVKAGSIIPLLQAFIKQHPARYRTVFEKDAERFKEIVFATVPDPDNPMRRIRDVGQQMAFVNGQMNLIPNKARSNRIIEPWKTYFSRLEKDPEFQKIQVVAVKRALDRARYWFNYSGFETERGFAFMFDLVASHGGSWLNSPKFKGTRIKLLRNMLAVKKAAVGRDVLSEREKMEVIANVIADVSLQEWRDQVRLRKLWFVRGSGTVHGRRYDIVKDFGVADNAPTFG